MANLIKPAALGALSGAIVSQRTEALDAIAAVLEDAVPRANLSIADQSREERRVVVTDGTTYLAAIGRVTDGAIEWRVYLVEGGGSQWTMKSGALVDLVSLGKALS